MTIEVEGGEPGLREIGAIIARAKREKVRALFIQPQFSQKVAKTIASQIGVPVEIADPMAGEWSENLLHLSESLCR